MIDNYYGTYPYGGQYSKTGEPDRHPITGEEMRPRPANNLVWSILATVLCCMPFGIVGIIYSTKVDDAYNRGMIAESYRYAKQATTWTIVSACCGAVVVVGYLIYAFVLVAAGIASEL